jgi:AraC-like DNA-binding protein
MNCTWWCRRAAARSSASTSASSVPGTWCWWGRACRTTGSRPRCRPTAWRCATREILPLLERARSGIEFFGLQEEAQQAFERIRASRGLQRLALFWDFMSRLACWTDLRELRAAPVARDEGEEDALARIEAVVQHVAAHRAQPLALPALARRFGMSDSRLSRFFRRATGQTLSDFVNSLRIAQACRLLHETDHYTGRIAREVGYRSVAAFNRRFVAVTGVTPTAYRCQKVSALARVVPIPVPDARNLEIPRLA